MDERLTIKKLGPITDLTIEPRPLTILIGEQASGKSLVSQVLYFFRTLKSETARLYEPERFRKDKWQEEVVKEILDDLRGEPFSYFANGTGSLYYLDISRKINWGVSVYSSSRRARAQKKLAGQMQVLVKKWTEDSEALGKDRRSNQIFIPTERSAFTRFWEKEPGVLFAEYQPLPFRRFADTLKMAQPLYQIFLQLREEGSVRDELNIFNFVVKCQQEALKGEAYVPKRGPQEWKFRILEGKKILPMPALASGQLEAWPFFAVAATFGAISKDMSFYFEEPETHLHPRAQSEVMKVIAYLVNRGRRFFLTTHSPYLLYVINNMLQAHQSYPDGVPEGAPWLNPDDVAAYRLTQGGAKDIMDRQETGLIDAGELEDVADELGAEFEDLLDRQEKNND